MYLLEEDNQLLIDIHTHIYLDVDYICGKNYPNHKKRSVYDRLRKLEKEEYIKREILPVPSTRNQVRKGSSVRSIVTLGKYGVEVVRELRGDVHWNYKWSSRVATFVHHSLMLAHVENAMYQESQKEIPIGLKEWINEARGTFQYDKNKSAVIRPDGLAVIGLKDKIEGNFGLFLEMERTYGTKEVIEKKLRRYNDFLSREEAQKNYDRYAGLTYPIEKWRLIFIAGNEGRQKELLRYMKEMDSPQVPVYVVMFEEILQNPFGAIYRSIKNPSEKVRL
ncbi:TPA: replication-relaxation family protein [Bacillus cereus]|nr:replication-relaxation family protein [Bacillus cereus]